MASVRLLLILGLAGKTRGTRCCQHDSAYRIGDKASVILRLCFRAGLPGAGIDLIKPRVAAGSAFALEQIAEPA
jgi:hypothetical protein